MKVGRIAVLTALFVAGIVAASVHSPASEASGCKVGTPAVVANQFVCLVAGQTCSKSHAVGYAKAGFQCVASKLVKKPTPKATTTTSTQVSTTNPAVPGQTRDDPIPLGQSAVLENGWSVEILSVNLDAASAIVASNPNNVRPPTGRQDVLVQFSATYHGVGRSRFDSNGTIHAIGPLNFVYDNSQDTCGSLPAPNLALLDPVTSPGDTITGYGACFQMSSTDTTGLVLFISTGGLSTKDAVWFAVK